MKKFSILLALVLFTIFCFGQNDELIYKSAKPGFYQDSILKSINAFRQGDTKNQKRYMSMDFSAYKNFPTDTSLYHPVWHNHPVSQGSTGTCWAYASTSFMESEVYRITGQKIKLSEMYTVYWEYVERTRYFVQHRGQMNFGEGSESNAILHIMKDHGMVSKSAYSGLLKGQRFHDHRALYAEIQAFLKGIKANNLWDEGAAVNTVKSILNHYMGTPPESFVFKGKNFTPLTFKDQVLKLKANDYFCFMSTMALPFNQKGILDVPDNWWRSDDYYNVRLDDFIEVINDALEKGYSVSICGDVSEPGYDRYAEVGIIPDYDIPAKFINQDSREFRFMNKTTTDDHCIHLIGKTEHDGQSWFMIKDSSSSGFDGPNKGYRFMREDYARLKILGVMVHKDAARKILDKIIK